MKIKLSKNQWESIGKKAGWITASESGMIPGQTPYTPEEKEKLNSLISDAAEGDPGEAYEDDLISRRRVVKVTFSDGDSLQTWINGTKQEILKHYLPYGNRGVDQDYDNANPEKLRHPVKVEFLN